MCFPRPDPYCLICFIISGICWCHQYFMRTQTKGKRDRKSLTTLYLSKVIHNLCECKILKQILFMGVQQKALLFKAMSSKPLFPNIDVN